MCDILYRVEWNFSNIEISIFLNLRSSYSCDHPCRAFLMFAILEPASHIMHTLLYPYGDIQSRHYKDEVVGKRHKQAKQYGGHKRTSNVYSSHDTSQQNKYV